MPYRLVPYDPARLPEILEIERALWSSEDDVNAAYFEWKYLGNPFLEDPHLYLAIHEGRVVGMRGFHGTAWHSGDESRRLVMPAGGDTVIVPEHQGRGLFERLNRYAFEQLRAEGFTFLCNLSAGPTTFLRSIRSGWRPVGRYRPMQRLRAESAGPDHAAGAGSSVEIEDEPRSKAMASLVRSLTTTPVFRQSYNRIFIDWRYRNPMSRYRFLYAGDTELDGYMVLQDRLFKRQPDTRIVDWECRSIRVFEALLGAVVTRIQPDCLMTWSATVPDDIRMCLERAGFRPLDDTLGVRHFLPGPLLARVDDDSQQSEWQWGGVAMTDLNRWRARMICSDGC